MSQQKTMQRSMKKKQLPPKKKYQPKNLEKRITKLEHADELKYFDVANSYTGIVTAGNIYVLNLISQGDDYNQRVGEEITAKYLNCKFRIRHTASADADEIRIIVFVDKQVNGTGPILYTSTSTTQALLDDTVAVGTMAPHNYRASERYTVLYDKLHCMNPDSTAVNKSIFLKFKSNLGGAKVKYSGSSSLLADVVSRGYFIAFLGQNCNASTVLTHNTRLWFTDS